MLGDARAIETVIRRYANAHDAGDLAALDRCFSNDCEFVYRVAGEPEPRLSVAGRGDLMRYFAGQLAAPRPRRRHLVANTEIARAGRGRATATTCVAVLTTPAGAAAASVAAGVYADELRRFRDGWRIVRRELTMDSPPA